MEGGTMKFDCPVIRYGRRTTKGNDDFYDILSKSPDFPDEAETFFRQRLCQSVQWIGSETEERYPDCFLFWKVSETHLLAAKLLDAGCDSRGRPHSIEIEAGWFEIGSVDSAAEILAKLVSTAEEYQYGEIIKRYLEGDEKSLLLAAHTHFLASGIDNVRVPECLSMSRSAPPPSLSSLPHAPLPNPLETKKRIGSFLLTGGEFVGFIALFGIVLFLYAELQKNTAQLGRQRKQSAQLITQLKQTQEELEETKKQMERNENELEETKRTLTETEERLEDMKRQQDTTAEREENLKYRAGLREIQGIVDDLSNKIQNLLHVSSSEE